MENVARLTLIAANDRRFQECVLRYVDATLDTRDVKKIRTKAIHKCNVAEKGFCKQLVVVANKALEANGAALGSK